MIFKFIMIVLNAGPLCLGNFSKGFSVDNMKKIGCMNMSMIFQLIMMILMLMILWIFINI